MWNLKISLPPLHKNCPSLHLLAEGWTRILMCLPLGCPRVPSPPQLISRLGALSLVGLSAFFILACSGKHATSSAALRILLPPSSRTAGGAAPLSSECFAIWISGVTQWRGRGRGLWVSPPFQYVAPHLSVGTWPVHNVMDAPLFCVKYKHVFMYGSHFFFHHPLWGRSNAT